MEIEDLRDIWKKQSEGFIRKDEAELAAMLKRDSISIITRLKRNVWFELIFTFLGGIGLTTYALTLTGGFLKWTSISIVVLFCIYSFYYFKKLRLLSRFEHGNDHVRANLQRLIINLKGYLKFYRRSYAILYPVYFILGLLFAIVEQGINGFQNRITRPEVFVTLILGAVVFFLCSTWLTSWYLKKLYGNHLEKLEALLRDIEVER